MSALGYLKSVRKSRRDVIRAFAVLVAGVPALVGGSAMAVFVFFPLPTVVPRPTSGSTAQTSFIYAADGSLIATLHAQYNRDPIPLSQIPKHLQDAAVASEDSRFYRHSGLDPKAVVRALLADVREREVVQGGSTITQQYVKNAYIERPKRTIFRKVREALYAAQIERTLTKKKILENYLNTVYLGKGAYGVEAAAKTYFNKTASELTVSESALVIGLIPAPVRFSPYEHPTDAEIRRIYVIDRMEQLAYLDTPTADAARAEKPKLASPGEEVFRFPWFADAVRRYLIAKYGEGRVFNGGLRVHTTLDPKMQDVAEKVIAQTLDREKDPYAALVAIDPKTGYVKAIVGGRDYNAEKFNIAIQGRRQPGSAFKPLVLVTALEEGMSPNAKYNGPGSICLKAWTRKSTGDCRVHNFGGSGYGRITLEKATINSVNTVYAQLVLDVGSKDVVDTAKRMGIPGPGWMPLRSRCKVSDEDDCRTRIDPLPSLALGSEEVTPLEMASAFATLAANGEYRAPKVVSKIVDPDGRVLESGPSDPVQVIKPAVAAKVNEILGKVIKSGTGKKADIGRPAAGKTGTAQDYKNAWFVGYTPDLSTAVWMGYRNANTPMRLVHGVRNVTGGTLPAQIWADFMKAALADFAPSVFSTGGPLEEEGFRLPYRPSPSPTESPTPPPSPSPSPSDAPTQIPSPIVTIPGGSPSPSPKESPT